MFSQKVYVEVENKSQRISLLNSPVKSLRSSRADLIDIHTNDDEVFPVRRRQLRPCIALTSVVQAGYGKYKDACEMSDNLDQTTGRSCFVDLSACTFDRVLLYLEHAARGEEFKFDPLLAPELLAAAEHLQISGLRECTLKVLGSFKDRVRKTPIRLDEIVRRNAAGTASAKSSDSGKRSDTLLILNGMVNRYHNLRHAIDFYDLGS
jgi:hypothetical protein